MKAHLLFVGAALAGVFVTFFGIRKLFPLKTSTGSKPVIGDQNVQDVQS
jgi:hypothetical protein